jgi:hypothetical protein
MYVQCNIVARSRNHCHREKAISITYSECLSVAFVNQQAKRMCCIIIVICALSGSTLFFHIIS